jgi:hypothetical protein
MGDYSELLFYRKARQVVTGINAVWLKQTASARFA